MAATRRVLMVVAVTALAVSGVAIGTGPPAAEAALSAGALYQTAIHNVGSTSGVHYSTRASTGGVTQTTVGDAGPTSGSELLVVDFGKGKVGRAQVRLVAGTVYVDADAGFLAGTGIVSDPPPAGTWMSMTPSDQYYSQFAAGLTTSSIVEQLTMSGPYSFRGTARVGGTRARAVRCATTQQTSSGSVTIPETVWVRTSGSPVPVLVTVADARAKESAVLSRFGEDVTVTVPAVSAPASQFGA